MKNSLIIFYTVFSLILPYQNAEAGLLKSISKLGAGGVKLYSSNTLTVEQLKSCLLLEQELDASDRKLNTAKESIYKKKNDIKQLEPEISSLRSYLKLNKDSTFDTQQKVDSFNSKVKRFNKLILIYNNEIDSYKKIKISYKPKTEKHNTFVNQFKSDCAGKHYYEDDMITVKIAIKNQ